MKTLKVYYEGQPQPGWSFGTFKGTQVGTGIKPRSIAGWQINSPDGCERLCEGNYQQFVPFANLILDNYGCSTRIS